MGIKFTSAGPVVFVTKSDKNRRLSKRQIEQEKKRDSLALLLGATAVETLDEYHASMTIDAFKNKMFSRFVDARLWKLGRSILSSLPKPQRIEITERWNSSPLPKMPEYFCYFLREVGVNNTNYNEMIDWYVNVVDEFKTKFDDSKINEMLSRAIVYSPSDLSRKTDMPSCDKYSHSEVRHILSLSGGKDSAALAIYLKDRVPNMEYVFCDTCKEIPEVYNYLEKLESVLGKKITILRTKERGFDNWLEIKKWFLPSPMARWCTRYIKIKPFEKYVGNDKIVNYIGIRADETRKGYVQSSKNNITARYPFIEDGITLRDVERILMESGVGIPEYYKWRKRSGCYFCFYQGVNGFARLLIKYPELFIKAASYEKISAGGNFSTWIEGVSLTEIARMARVARPLNVEIASEIDNDTLQLQLL